MLVKAEVGAAAASPSPRTHKRARPTDSDAHDELTSLASLSSAQAGALLALLGFGEVGRAFVQQSGLTGATLVHASNEDLAELGVKMAVQRKALLAQLAELKAAACSAARCGRRRSPRPTPTTRSSSARCSPPPSAARS